MFKNLHRKSYFSPPLVHAIGLLIIAFLSSPVAFGQSNVLTQQYDNGRTGQNAHETMLTKSNVNENEFGKLFSLPVDGPIYAQPLYVSKAKMPGGVHNLLVVATANDSVYAFDADSAGEPLWKASLLDAAHGGGAGESSPGNLGGSGCAGDTWSASGIVGTPAIDASSMTVYVEAKSTDGSNFFQRVHALHLLTGAEKFSGPVEITAAVSAANSGISKAAGTFDPSHQVNRSGLLLLDGTIYVAFDSPCELVPSAGWLFAYNAATLEQKSVYAVTAKGEEGGMWEWSGDLAADVSGNIFIAGRNAASEKVNIPSEQAGNTILKLAMRNRQLTLLDYFAAQHPTQPRGSERETNSGGVLLLPDQPGKHPHILVQAGEDGRIYVVDRDQMTTGNSHTCVGCSDDTEIVEESTSNGPGSLYGPLAFWNNAVYLLGPTDGLQSIPIINGLPDFSQIRRNPSVSRFSAAAPLISSNGTTAETAIVWVMDSNSNASAGPAVLHAYDATDITNELWNSMQGSGNGAGTAMKSSIPTVANGKVYIATANEIDVYGLLNAGTLRLTTKATSHALAMATAAPMQPAPMSASVALATTSGNFAYVSGSTTGAFSSGTSSGSTLSVTLHHNPGPGHLLICGATWQSSTATASMSDPNNGRWLAIGSAKTGLGNLGGYRGQIFYVPSAVGASTKITLTTSSAVVFRAFECVEYSYAGSIASLDGTPQYSNASASGSTATIRGLTTSNSGDLVFAACLGVYSTCFAGSGYTGHNDTNTYNAAKNSFGNNFNGITGQLVEEKVGVAAGSQSATFRTGTSNDTVILGLMAMKSSGTTSFSLVAPSITTQPQGQTVTVGKTATFLVAADGTAPLSYQWQKNGTNISGATGASYTTPATTTGDSGGTYRVVVSNSAGKVTSNSATLTVSSSMTKSYSTSFSLVENPISEGGNWINGGTVGLDWGNVQTKNAEAFGTILSGAPPYNDSTAVLKGTWASNQMAQVTVHTVNQNSAIQEEVELRLRTTITAHSIKGYEFGFRCTADGSQYLALVRWNGPLNNFTYLQVLSPGGPGLRNGDVIKVTAIGNTLTAYINGVKVMQATDSTYTGGSPGIGFWNHGGSLSNSGDFGFTHFTASEL